VHVLTRNLVQLVALQCKRW